MSQANTWSPTTGTVSGLQVTTNYNNAFSAINTMNSGATAPANDQSAAAVMGQFWLNTSTNPHPIELYDGSNWTTVGWLDTTNHQFIPNNAGGTGTIASAATTDLGTVLNPIISVTGTTTITSFGTTALGGDQYFLTFAGVLTLTHNATSLILPNNGSNIVTAAGDCAIAVALGSGNWRVVSYQAASGTPLQSTASVTAQSLAASALAPNAPPNLRINASVASNALTLTVVGVNNATPSASNPIPVIFRDATIANGDPVEVSITSALSMTIPAGATLGAANSVFAGVTNTPFRVWIVLFNSGGTPVLGVINPFNSGALSVMSLMEETLQSPINGAGNTAQTFYSAAGVSANSAFRILGYFEYAAGLATVGTYNIAPTKVQLFGSGMKKPGDLVQTVLNLTTTVGSTTSATLAALSSGQSQAITPTSACNLIRLAATGCCSVGNLVVNFGLQIARGSTLIGQPVEAGNQVTQNYFGAIAIPTTYDLPASTSAVTYNIYGKTGGSTLSYPISGYGASLEVQEIQL